MIGTLLLSFVVLTDLAKGTPAEKKDGYIQMSMRREVSEGTSSLMASLVGNSSSHNISLVDNRIYYRSSCYLGTPGQIQELIVDTGSPEVWVYGPDMGDAYSSFNISESSSVEWIDDDLVLSYLDHSSFHGSHYSDDFSFSGVTIAKQEFGYVDSASAKNGTAIWGLSPWLSGENPTYPTMINNLKSQGFIKKEAYSMSLNDNEGQEASIIFGALDRSKYTGDLWSQKITLPDRFTLNLTGVISAEGESTTFSSPQSALLDSGTTGAVIPDETLAELVKGFNVTFIPVLGLYFWNEKPTSGEVSFLFGEAEIKVPATSFYNEEPIFGLHLFTAFGASFYNESDLTVLGDSFLRSAYVVYSYDDWEIAIAQASDSSGAEDIVVFDDTPGIPGAKFS